MSLITRTQESQPFFYSAAGLGHIATLAMAILTFRNCQYPQMAAFSLSSFCFFQSYKLLENQSPHSAHKWFLLAGIINILLSLSQFLPSPSHGAPAAWLAAAALSFSATFLLIKTKDEA